jgi:hypothetical protein
MARVASTLLAFLLLGLAATGLGQAFATRDCLPGEDLIDADLDAVSTCLEQHLGLDPLAIDTDGDGVSDHADLVPNVNQNPILTVSLLDITEVTETCDVSNNKYFDPYIGNAFARLPLTTGNQLAAFPTTGFNLKDHPHDHKTDSFSAQSVKLTGAQDMGVWKSTYFSLPGVDINVGMLDHDSTNADDRIDTGANVPVAIPAYQGPDAQPITQTLMGSDGTCAACVSVSVASPIRYEDAVQVTLPPTPPGPGLPAMVTWQQFEDAVTSGAGLPPPQAANCAGKAGGNTAGGAGSTGLLGGDLLGMVGSGVIPSHPIIDPAPCPTVPHKHLFGAIGAYQNSISGGDYWHDTPYLLATVQASGTGGYHFARSSNLYETQNPMVQDAVALPPIDLVDPDTCESPERVTVTATLAPTSGSCCGAGRSFEVVTADLPDDGVYAVTTGLVLFTNWGAGYDIGDL